MVVKGIFSFLVFMFSICSLGFVLYGVAQLVFFKISEHVLSIDVDDIELEEATEHDCCHCCHCCDCEDKDEDLQ